MKRFGWLFAACLMLPFGASAPAFAATLDVVAPATSCASLADTDMTGIGGDGSRISAAEETTSDGVAVCRSAAAGCAGTSR